MDSVYEVYEQSVYEVYEQGRRDGERAVYQGGARQRWRWTGTDPARGLVLTEAYDRGIRRGVREAGKWLGLETDVRAGPTFVRRGHAD